MNTLPKNEVKLTNALDSSPLSTDHSLATRLRQIILRRWDVVAVLALATILWLPRLSGPIDLRWDAGVYYTLGTSLATGKGYRILSEPGTPEALQYPPLLPAFVAVYECALGSNDPAVVAPWMRISYATLCLMYGLATLALARRYLCPAFAGIAVAFSLLQVNTLFISDLLFAELPFALVSVLFALIALTDSDRIRPWLREALSFLLAATGFLLRTAGIALLAAWIIESLFRRRWGLAVTRAVIALVPIFAWQTHVVRVRSSYEYAHPAYPYQRAPYQFYNVSYAENVRLAAWPRSESNSGSSRGLPRRFVKNSFRMGKRLGETISTSEGYWRAFFAATQRQLFHRVLVPKNLVVVPIAALSALVAAGIGLLVYRRDWLIALILITSITLICTTPWPDQFQRYLMPLAPFLAISAMFAVREIQTVLITANLARANKVVCKVALIGTLLLLLLLQIYAASDMFRMRKLGGATPILGWGDPKARFFYRDAQWRGWEQAIVWLREHASPNAIIATPYSHLCYLLTGRHAVAPPVEPDVGRARYLLSAVPVSFVIVDRGYSLGAVENDAPEWQLVQSFQGTRLYQNSATVQSKAR